MWNFSSIINMVIMNDIFSRISKQPVYLVYIVVICIGIWCIFSWALKKLIKTSIVMLGIIVVLSLAVFTPFLDDISIYAQFIIVAVLGVLFFVVYEYESSND
ncbi:hypothetical protein [Priestia aryabhattai]|uniref:hypothetical protein n=1 Tax=Priestia aryabhattai TaxID=412384 RepID=UPI003CEAB1E6